MRGFLAAVIGTAVAALGLWLCTFYFGFYIDLHPDAPIEVLFRVNGQALERRTTGGYEPLSLRAVDVSSSMPGRPFSDGAPEKADYLRWLEQIGAMGANAVQAGTILDEDFYNALYEYDTTHDEPLYLMQVLPVTDEANFGEDDAYGKEFFQKLTHDGKAAVDVIHGRRNVAAGTSGAVGYYRKDLSPWTLGYIVGYEWSSDTVAYTDHSVARPDAYEGQYISSGADASRFEVMLCQVMDEIVSYEADKYKQQRLISFANDPANDPFEYDPVYASQLSKFSRIDAEHVVQRDFSGFFAAYRIFDFCADPISCFSQQLRQERQQMLAGVDRSALYGGYLQLLGAYHTMPLYLMSYGFSTARMPLMEGEQPLTEAEQGQALVRVWREAADNGFAGVCISSWQDVWERRAWNTSFATVLTRASWWHDLQTDGQNYGLMAFVPGAAESVCTLDGLAGEWDEADQVLSADGMTLAVRYDPEGLYLLIEGEDLADRPVYVPIDLTSATGAGRCEDPALTFDGGADFLLCLNGPDDSRFLVQDRYDAAAMNFGENAGRGNPFLGAPDPDSPSFGLSWLPVSKKTLLSQEEITAQREQGIQWLSLAVWETGRLVHGCGDPTSADYNSLTDFCYGERCAEVRIPWLLLNVSDPSRMMIHEDYYDYYGVKSTRFRLGSIGLGDGEGTISMSPLTLKGWDDQLPCRERLKQSYDIVREAWEAAG